MFLDGQLAQIYKHVYIGFGFVVFLSIYLALRNYHFIYKWFFGKSFAIPLILTNLP